jgi:hypothetical protein
MRARRALSLASCGVNCATPPESPRFSGTPRCWNDDAGSKMRGVFRRNIVQDARRDLAVNALVHTIELRSINSAVLLQGEQEPARDSEVKQRNRIPAVSFSLEKAIADGCVQVCQLSVADCIAVRHHAPPIEKWPCRVVL